MGNRRRGHRRQRRRRSRVSASNLFQLFSTYYGEDARLNIGPKGFTGEKYGGATYWDTEAYAVPLYLALAEPEVTRNLLQYRRNHCRRRNTTRANRAWRAHSIRW